MLMLSKNKSGNKAHFPSNLSRVFFSGATQREINSSHVESKAIFHDVKLEYQQQACLRASSLILPLNNFLSNESNYEICLTEIIPSAYAQKPSAPLPPTLLRIEINFTCGTPTTCWFNTSLISPPTTNTPASLIDIKVSTSILIFKCDKVMMMEQTSLVRHNELKTSHIYYS